MRGFSLESACLLGIMQQQEVATICHYCVQQSYAAKANTFHVYHYIVGACYIYCSFVFQSVDHNFDRASGTLCSTRLVVRCQQLLQCVQNFCNYTLPISSNIFISFERGREAQREREVRCTLLLTLFRAKRNSVR